MYVSTCKCMYAHIPSYLIFSFFTLSCVLLFFQTSWVHKFRQRFKIRLVHPLTRSPVILDDIFKSYNVSSKVFCVLYVRYHIFTCPLVRFSPEPLIQLFPICDLWILMPSNFGIKRFIVFDNITY